MSAVRWSDVRDKHVGAIGEQDVEQGKTRLLSQVRPDCRLIGLCYECQLFDDLIVNRHDVFMDKVVTERAVYPGRGRRPAR